MCLLLNTYHRLIGSSILDLNPVLIYILLRDYGTKKKIPLDFRLGAIQCHYYKNEWAVLTLKTRKNKKLGLCE